MVQKKQPVHRKVRWRYGLAATFAVTLAFNGLAGSTTLLGGITTAAVSDSYPNLFAPAGVTFAIWGVIYVLLAGFVAYTFGLGRPKQSALAPNSLTTITKLLVLNLGLNTAWILSWQYNVMWLSVLLIAGLLATLVLVIQTLHSAKLTGREYVLAKLPFSIYFGWITVATVANVTTWLVSIGWNGWGLSKGTWMVAVLLIAATIGLVTALRYRDAAYLAVFVWAYAGILLKHLSPDGFNGAYPTTVITLAILLAVFISTVLSLLPKLRRRP